MKHIHVLELTTEEAQVLKGILWNIGGAPQYTWRGVADEISLKLNVEPAGLNFKPGCDKLVAVGGANPPVEVKF